MVFRNIKLRFFKFLLRFFEIDGIVYDGKWIRVYDKFIIIIIILFRGLDYVSLFGLDY